MNPSPDVQVCLDCGYSEFLVPTTWLSAGWLRESKPATGVEESMTASLSTVGV